MKVLVSTLNKDELSYELEIRGLLVKGDTVELMRQKLRSALKEEAEGDTSFIQSSYPFTYDEDKEVLQAKLKEVEELVETYKKSQGELENRKIRAKVSFAMRRTERAPANTKAQQEEIRDFRGKFLLLLSSLYEEEQDSEGEGLDSVPRGSSTPLSVVSSMKAGSINVGKWNLRFCGDHSGSVNAFIERAEELRMAKGLTKAQLFRAAVELFEDRALIWFRANREKIGGWDRLVEELKAEFLPSDYDDRLRDEIRRRTQGRDETMGVYVATMERMFNRLSTSCEEAEKLRILRRNIAPFYQQQLGLTSIQSTDELVRLGRIIESTRAAVEAFVPPAARSRRTLEPDLAYAEAPETGESTSAMAAALTCWTCRREGHLSRECSQQIRCFGCGAEGVIRTDCWRCKCRPRADARMGEDKNVALPVEGPCGTKNKRDETENGGGQINGKVVGNGTRVQ